MSLFPCCTGLGTMVENKVQVCNSGFTNTVYSLLLNGKSRDHKQTHTWKLPKRNRNSISLFLDLVSLALAYLHYLSYSSPLLRLTSS
ncbi:hypothetical protein ACN42_g5689 [Penicillium freii]|uniref:Uncharacterized protein n=1 Tax=Penicillium freii TaxID=48697 RepID=A0A124GRJ2_PENFR|nr:hypothetical protein ACN42_g5689 [Penicillium freii]